MVTSVSRAQLETKLDNLAVKARQLRKQYRNGTKAMDGIDLNVSSGKLFGLIGPDGSGKTTMLKILAGVMEPTSGEVLVFGRQPSQVRSLIGHVTQNFSLYPDLTVDENLAYEAGVRGVDALVFRERRERILRRLGLLQFGGRLAGDLSGGMKQKLSVCCALIARPRLLLLDEPTTGLDPLSRRELWKVVKEVVHAGITTVFATPVLEEAELCDRVALMYSGRIERTGTPDELKDALALRRLEVLMPDIEQSERAMSYISAHKPDEVVDLYSFGDRVNILLESKARVAVNVQALLEKGKLIPDMVHVSEPNLENVFVMCLRDLGVTEIEPPEFPRLRDLGGKSTQDKGEDLAINAEKLNMKFGEFQAVSDIAFDVRFGEIYGLLGANGAGKTTTIKMLCGLLEPTSGTVTLLGERANLRSREVRRQIGYMSQKFTLYDDLTIRENFEFYSTIYEIPREFRQKKIQWALKASGLSEIENSPVRSLPRGWKQRIAFGCSVMHEPKVLILDEPTAGVDPLARRQLWTMIRRFASSGTAILITTHYMQEAEYCNRLALMTQGQIVAKGSPRDIKSKQPGKIFEMSCDNTQRACEALEGAVERWRISMFDSSIQLMLDKEDPDLDEIKRKLKEEGVKIRSLRSVPYSLEDAFVAIVHQNGNGNNANGNGGSHE